jgi:hypothetical protein
VTQDSPRADDPERTQSTEVDGPTVWADPADQPAVSSESPAGTPVASWSLDDIMREVPDGPEIRREPRVVFPEPAPEPKRRGGYYASLLVAVLVVAGLVGGLVLLSLNRPVAKVSGEATGLPIPELPSPTQPGPPPSTVPPEGDPLAALAEHPLSTATATMTTMSCALPRFDTADESQASFYEAAKICADDAFGDLLRAAGLPAAGVPVVSVQDGPRNTPCGAIQPDAPPAQCEGTVYMTPQRLRDVEGLGLFPGKYFGVFLRTYASAVQYTTGLTELYERAKDSPDAPGNLANRLAQQATCLAGVASSAMSGKGAVDDNITNEIRERLTTTDAPPAAGTWLAKGFQSRQPASCNTWA